VDYGKDDQWTTWSEEALRRLLVKCEVPRTSVASVPTPWITPLQLPTRANTYIPESWSRLGAEAVVPMPPVFLDTKFESDKIFGPDSKALALEEGDMWELDTVRFVNCMA
jgi:hypothetical protein